VPQIIGLPPELVEVPPAPSSPDDPDRVAKRQAWVDWRAKVVQYRDIRRVECENPEEWAYELGKCKTSTAYFLSIWGNLFEPRKRKRSAGYGGEFIPFAKQVEVLDAITECLAVEDGGPRSDLAVPKSRDVGASWIVCGEALKQWLFDEDIQIRLMSYKEELVESKKSGSLFWKIDYMLHRLPHWMVPKYNDVHLVLTNLENGNILGGEATTERSARGDRATWIIFDEAGLFPEFGEIWTGSTAAADTRVAVSSIHVDYGPDFFNLSMSDETVYKEQPVRLPIDWWDHPLHDEAWLEQEKLRYRLRPAGFYREVLRNPFTENETLVYPEAQAIVPRPEITYDHRAAQFTTMDPGKRDDFAVIFLQEDAATGFIHVLDSYSSSQKPADYYGSIMVGIPESGDWKYDDEALRIMAFTRNRMRATVYGDVAGWNQEAATMDSVYDRLVKYGIYVIRDRLKDEQVAQSKRVARSFRGRREAMHDIFPRLRFADTPGARRVLAALKMHRFKPGDQMQMTEDQAPIHDWTSHLTSAMEYYAVNRRLERMIIGIELSAPPKQSRANSNRRAANSIARWERSQGVRQPW
jgi:hypothetical protein